MANPSIRRTLLLLLAAIIGLVTSLAGAMAMVPRVRSVEVVTVFFSAFAAGASFVGAIVEFRRGRLSRPGR